MRAQLKIIVLLAGAAVLFSSCRKDKDEPLPGQAQPVFHASGTLNGQPFQIQAGVNDYYMFSSCPANANQVYEYTGSLHSRTCNSNCPNSLTLRIRDYQPFTAGTINVDQSLAPGNYTYYNASNFTPLVNFNALLQPGDSLINVSWSFGGSTASTSHNFSSWGTYPVTMTAAIWHNSFTTTCTASDSVYVYSPPEMSVAFTTVNADVDSADALDSLQFNATVSGGTPPYNFSWNFGDASSGPGSNPVHGYAFPGIYAAQLHVSDAMGHNVWRQMNVVTPHSDSSTVNFSWQQALPADFSLVDLEWTDAAGHVYSSVSGPQPPGTYFQVVSQEEYMANENHEPTRKIHVLADCLLYGASDTLRLQNADIIFAVAHH